MENDRYIWLYLKQEGFTDNGAAAMLGNLFAESALNPCNLQNTFNSRFGVSDTQYTQEVDSGKRDFINDGAGYGLAQWTYYTRKRGLQELAERNGTSVGHIGTQCEYIINELEKNYPDIMKDCTASGKTVDELTRTIMLYYERPADTSVSKQNARIAFADRYFDMFADSEQPVIVTLGGVEYEIRRIRK